MDPPKRYVEPGSQGVLRVGSLGVTLDSVVIAFQDGHSPETIQQRYPALSLEEVYGAVAYYLANRNEVDQYLKARNKSGSKRISTPRRIRAPSCNVSVRQQGSGLAGAMSRPQYLGRQLSQRRDRRGYTTTRADLPVFKENPS